MHFLYAVVTLALTSQAAVPTESVCVERTTEMKKATAFDESGERFQDKGGVDWVLNKFSSYTSGPTEYGERLTAIVTKLPRITNEDIEDLFYKVRPCIGVIAQYQALQGLLKSVRFYNLGPEKEKASTQLVIDFIKQQSESPAVMIEYAIYAALLKQLVDGQFVTWEKKKLDALTAIQKQIEGAKAKAQRKSKPTDLPPESLEAFRKLNAKQKRVWSEQLSFELVVTEKIRKQFRAF